METLRVHLLIRKGGIWRSILLMEPEQNQSGAEILVKKDNNHIIQYLRVYGSRDNLVGLWSPISRRQEIFHARVKGDMNKYGRSTMDCRGGDLI
jgi:hypothetical protein